MQRTFSLTLLGLTLAAQLLATGCKLGGSSSGTGSLFDGGSEAGSSSFAGLSSGSGSSGSGGNVIGFGSPVHNPEPASVALFGAGLAGFAVWRRRTASKKS